MNKKDVELKKKIIEKRKVVKQKLSALKEGEIIQEQSFSPITKRLQTIVEKLDNDINIKNEFPDDDVQTNVSFDYPKTSKSKHKPLKSVAGPSFIEAPVIAEDVASNYNNENYDDDDDNLDQSVREAREFIQSFADSPAISTYLEEVDPLPRKYVHDMIADVDNQFDFKYGVRFDPDSNTLKIGNAPIQLNDKDIIIDGLTYKGTVGLYELLFKKHPVGFKQSDLKTYLDIVKRTNAHRRGYLADGQIQGNGSYKYKKIISSLNILPRTPRKPRSRILITKNRMGHGMFMKTSSSPIDYVYWDDPNELVDRLRLLVASQTAGHTGHVNEIISIIEELRESKIIQ